MLRVKPLIIALGFMGLGLTSTAFATDELREAASANALGDTDWLRGVTIGGTVEVNAFSNTDYADVETSDIQLATVELAIDAQVHKWASAHILFLYEEDATDPPALDAGYITLGNTDYSPIYLSAGKMYNFGNYETNMISDPVTLEIGEMQETVLLLGMEMQNGLYGSMYVFNGDTSENANDENKIEHYGANLGFANDMGNMNYDVGVGYISSLGDTGSLTDAMGSNANNVVEYVAGLEAHLYVAAGPFNFIAEYVAALDPFNAATGVTFNGVGAEPKSWNAELGYTLDIAGRETTFAVGYQGTDEALVLGLPKTRTLLAASVGIYDNTSISLEWAHDKDYDKADGGTGEKANTITLQFAVDF